VALLASGAAAQNAAAQDAAAEEVAALFESGRYDLALNETSFIESPQLRAEWRFHVLYNAGNLPAALDEALAGLDAAPQSLDLARNAVLCALTLGLGGVAEDLLARWKAAIESSSLDEAAREAWLRMHAEQSAFAAQVLARDEAAADAARRALWICVAGFGLAFGALLVLSRAPSDWLRADEAPVA
jgi:hypothetical protein